MKSHLPSLRSFVFGGGALLLVRDASSFSPAPRPRSQCRGVVATGKSSRTSFRGTRSLGAGVDDNDRDGESDRASIRADHERNPEWNPTDHSRRQFLATLGFWTGHSASLFGYGGVLPAHAGLLTFPCDLVNRYHFMRAGLSELEADNIYSTNALFLTNRDNAMVTNDDGAVAGSILEACRIIEESGEPLTRVFHSLAANGMDTGDLLARTLQMGRDRLLPEFTYLDQRGIGMWDSSDYTRVKKAVMAMDYYEAGRDGARGRPPPTEDGTPNETLQDQFVRLRQFLSLQESRTSGENILVIFPDGTGPALLSCMIAGLPLNECHCLDYAPGEIRLNVDRNSVREMYDARKDDPKYLADLEEGREILAQIRKDGSADSMNVKDQKAEADRAAAEEEYLRKQAMKEEEDRARREEMERAREEARLKQEEANKARMMAQQEAKEKREEEERQRREELRLAREERERAKAEKDRLKEEERARREAERALAAGADVAASSSPSAETSSDGSPIVPIAGAVIAGLGGVVAMAAGGGDDDPASAAVATDAAPAAPRAAEGATSVSTANGDAASSDAAALVVDSSEDPPASEAAPATAISDAAEGSPNGDGVLETNEEDGLDAREVDDNAFEEELGRIAAAEDVYLDMVDGGDSIQSTDEDGEDVDGGTKEALDQELDDIGAAADVSFDYSDTTPQKEQVEERVKVAAGIITEEEYGDDFYDLGWLDQIAAIRDEED